MIKPLGRYEHFFQAILIYIVVIVNILPQFRIFSIYNFLWLIPMLVWFLFILIQRRSFFSNLRSPLNEMLFFIVLTVTIPYIFGNYSIGNRFLSLSQIPFFYFAYYFNAITRNKKTNRLIILWSIPPILVTTLNTTIGLLKDPQLSRNIKSAGLESETLWKQGIGGYDFIYFLVFISIIFFCILFFKKTVNISKKKWIIGISILAILVITIVLSNYFTALIMLLTSITIFLLFKKITTLKLLFLTFTFITFGLWGSQIRNSALDSLIQIIPKGLTSDRLSKFKTDAVGEKSTDMYYEDRAPTQTKSINAFIQNPITGIIVNQLKIKDDYFSEFGQHSQILDTLALFGIIGFLQIYFIVKIFLQRIKRNEVNLNAFTWSVLISVLILNIFNNTTGLIGFAYFFIFPTAFSWLRDNHSNVKNRIYGQRN